MIEVYLKEHTKRGIKTYVTGFVLARKIEQNMERMMEVDNNGLNVLNRLGFVMFSTGSECRLHVLLFKGLEVFFL